MVDSGRTKKTGFYVIGEVARNNDFEKLSSKFLIENRENDFDAAVEIARHEIGAPKIDVGIAPVVENIDAAMFEETIDDASDGDVLAEARDAWAQATNSTNQELDGDPFLGGVVEGLNNFFVHKGVGFNKNTGGPACAAVGAEVYTAPMTLALPGRGKCASMLVRNPGSGALQELFQVL